MRFREAARFLPAIAWSAVIFRLSSIPGSQVPGNYGWIGHLVEYTVLGALLMWALIGEGLQRRMLASVAFASLYGVTDEVHQLFVAGRQADPVDWLVDTAGALLGATLVVIAARMLRRAEEQ